MGYVPAAGPAVCGGPCGRTTPHETIRPVDRRLIPIMCLVCGTVRSVRVADLPLGERKP